MTTSTTTIETSSSSQSNLLQKAIRANAVFSGLSGLVFLLAAGPIAELMGLAQPAFLSVTGILLLLYMPTLLAAARKNPVPKWIAWLIIDLDILWVIGSAVLIFTALVPLTAAGKWLIAIQADIVALFAIVQFIGLRRQG